jgi:DNA-damage-inducible protein J
MTAVTTRQPADVCSRIDPDLKDRASEVLAALGLNLSDAIRLFLHEIVAQDGLPFEVKTPNAATIAAMRQARSMKRPESRRAGSPFGAPRTAGAARAGKPAKKGR